MLQEPCNIFLCTRMRLKKFSTCKNFGMVLLLLYTGRNGEGEIKYSFVVRSVGFRI